MNDDDELREWLTDAVSEVEPGQRLSDIRERTAASPRRVGWYAAGGAVLATAATVAIIAAIGTGNDPRHTTSDPAGDPSAPYSGGYEPTGPQTTDPSATAPSGSVKPVYYVGSGPDGPEAPSDVLYRYFEPGAPLLDLLMQTPSDPDYRTLWAEGSLVDVSGVEGGVVSVTIADASLHDRPADMSAREAELAIEQVVYTVQGYLQDPRVAVQFKLGDNPVDQVYGVPTSEPVTNQPELDVLSHMSISDPAEGRTYSHTFTARGRSNGYEANVVCRILGQGGAELSVSSTTAAGWTEPHLFPWELQVDLELVPSGTYTFTCTTDDPTGGSQGRGADIDTRTIVVD